MSNSVATGGSKAALKQYLGNEEIKKKFQEVLGNKAQGFLASVLQVVNTSDLLMKADPATVMNAAMMAAVVDLPIQSSLGYAYIVPYKGQAQFQIGWKGLVQLAQRSGQYHQMNVVEVYKNQFISYNAMTEQLIGDFQIEGSGEIVGYCAYFRLLNGFEKTVYWSKEKVIAHAQKYSQAYKSERGVTPWKDKDQFHEMAKKTVLKNTISKWGPMTVDIQRVVNADQGVIKDMELQTIEYPDNKPDEHGERERFSQMLTLDYPSLEDFQTNVLNRVGEDLKEEFAFEIALKIEELKANEVAND